MRVASVGESQPAPPPEHCADYPNMETGAGHPTNQDWFNHLDAAGYARVRMACVYLWDGAQYEALDRIVMAESRWNHFAYNPTSSAYGVPQACPGSKMSTAGADWRTNPRTQVRWMLQYVRDRYGTPENAAYHRFHYGMY